MDTALYPTPPQSSSDGSSTTSWSSNSGKSPAKQMIPVAPYLEYVPPAKREKLALAEFEIAMMEREVRVAELDQQRQKFLTPKRRPYTIPYSMSDEKLKRASANFPRTLFRVGQDAHHDHPSAHLDTMMGTDRIARMFEAGSQVLDIFGSPKRCAQYNAQQARSNNPKKFSAVVKYMSEKDYLRASGWNNIPKDQYFLLEDDESMESAFDVASWFKPRQTDGYSSDTINIMAINTLYYMTDEFVALLVSRPKTKMLALIHKHPQQSGEMFDGEMRYAKRDGMVEQENVETGERYVHKDVSWIFTSTTKVKYTDRGAFVWTLHKVTEETWIVEIVGCPSSLNERYTKRCRDAGDLQAMTELNEHAELPSTFPHPTLAGIPGTTVKMVGTLPIVTVTDSQVAVNVTTPELVEFIALHVAGKPRDAVRYADCYAMAVGQIYDGIDRPGKLNFRVKSTDLPGHIFLGYTKAFGAELAVARALPSHAAFFKEYTAHIEGHSLSLDGADASLGTHAAAMALSRFNEASKKGNRLDGVLHALNM